MDLSTKKTMKPSEKTKSDNEENTHYSQENTVKIEKRYISRFPGIWKFQENYN